MSWRSLNRLSRQLKENGVVLKRFTDDDEGRALSFVHVRSGIGERCLEQGYAWLPESPKELAEQLDVQNPPRAQFVSYQRIDDSWYLFQRRARSLP